jgi:hypothetical protein
MNTQHEVIVPELLLDCLLVEASLGESGHVEYQQAVQKQLGHNHLVLGIH